MGSVALTIDVLGEGTEATSIYLCVSELTCFAGSRAASFSGSRSRYPRVCCDVGNHAEKVSE